MKPHSAAYKLFHYPYLWLVPRGELFDINDTEVFGRLTTNNRDWDRQLARTEEAIYMPPADAAHLLGSGVKVTLHDPSDAVKIYPMIIEHLQNWMRQLESDGAWQRKPPIDGLREFNQLAEKMAKQGRRHGLVEQYRDRGAEKAHKRKFELGYEAPRRLKDYSHQNDVFNRIMELSKTILRRYEVKDD